MVADCWQLVRANSSSDSSPRARVSLLDASLIKKMSSWIKNTSVSSLAALVDWCIKITCSVTIGCLNGLLFRLENVPRTFVHCRTPSGHAR